MWLTEITTIFINFSWYINKQNLLLEYKKISIITYICMSLSYLYHRIYNIIKLILLMNVENTKFIYISIVSIYFLLNIYWTYKVFKMINKKIKYIFNN